MNSSIFSILSIGVFLELQLLPHDLAITVPYKKQTNDVTNNMISESAMTMIPLYTYVID
jgi:hypothetical protein